MNTNAAVKSLPSRDVQLEGTLSWEGVGAEADWEFAQDGARAETLGYALLALLGQEPGRVRITIESVPTP